MSTKPQKSRRRPQRLPRQSKSMMTFNVVAVVVVGALVFGAVGLAVFDELFSGSGDNNLTIDPAEEDPIEEGYRDQIAANPDDVAAMSALANYLGNTGKVEEAIQWYEKALTITPDDMSLRLDFASALASGAKFPDAELQYLKVIEVEPENAFAILGLARLYRSWSPPRTSDAITYYQMAIDRAGESVVRDVAADELAQLTGTPVSSPAATPDSSPVP